MTAVPELRGGPAEARCILLSASLNPLPASKNASGKKFRDIVIVDDDPTAIAVLRDLVETMEMCRAVPFTSSAKALDWCKTNDPDLVLVDYLMPPPDGLNFIGHFRKMEGKEEIPLIMITGEDEQVIRRQALKSGANDFLIKPFDMVEFRARMKNMLALRNRQKELSYCALHLADEVRRATASLLRQEQETIFLLCRAAELRDPDTGAHLQRMSCYSRHIAANLGLGEQEQDLIFKASPLHDIGKVAVPEVILQKRGELEADEFAVIKRHTVLGHEILRESASPILRFGAEIALTHHEKYDGSGYPHRLTGEEIPLCGRIAAVADVFDALTSQRPYKGRWEPETAAGEISSLAGSHFDPGCVTAFLKGWDEVLAIHDLYRG